MPKLKSPSIYPGILFSRAPDGAKYQASIRLRKHKRFHGSRTSGCFKQRRRKRRKMDNFTRKKTSSRSLVNRWKQKTRAKKLNHLGRRRRRRLSCTRTLQFRGSRNRSDSLCPSLVKLKSGKKNKGQTKLRLKAQKRCNGPRVSRCLKPRKRKRWRMEKSRKKKRKNRAKVFQRERRRIRCAKEKLRRRRIFFKLKRRARRGRSFDQPTVLEGDIMFTKDQMNRVINNVPGCSNKRRGGRAAKNKQEYKWPGGLVTYEFSSEICEGEKAKIRNALQQLQAKLDSCVRFQETASGNRILVKNSGKPCCSSSYVGYSVHESRFKSSGVQPLELGSFEEGTIWHEFLHAVGLEHTMAREDRDNYVKILWENVIQGKGAKAL